MLLRIMLWAMLIGSVVMGYFGIQSGSATNAATGIGILLLVGFAIYFLIKIFFRMGFWAIKGVLIILLITAIIFICVRGCQFLLEKDESFSQNTITNKTVFSEKIKSESTWEKFTSFFKGTQKDKLIIKNSNNEMLKTNNIETLPETINGKVTDVSSGYLFKIGNHFIKLYGIDTPDPTQKCRDKRNKIYSCGHESKQHLERLILGKTVECKIAGGDYKENYIASCAIQNVDVGVAMVSLGWAVADRMTSDVYIPYESEAKRKHIGLWAGKFVAPWQNRKQKIKKNNQQKTSEKGFLNEWF